MTRDQATVGLHVAIHPACDWFMRGAKFGTITSLGKLYAYVRPEVMGRPLRRSARITYELISRDDLCLVCQQPTALHFRHGRKLECHEVRTI